MPIVKANGLDIFYDEFGRKKDPAVLLIMGLATQMIAWPEALCRSIAAQGFRVIRFDNRDNGLSQKMEEFGRVSVRWIFARAVFGFPGGAPYSLEDMASDAIGVLDGLKIERAHIVGASMGGMIAQIVAAQYPERCLSLTSIMSSSGRYGLPGPTAAVREKLTARRPPMPNRETAIAAGMELFRLIGSPAYPPGEQELYDRIAAFVDRSIYPAGFKRQLAAVLSNGSRVSLLRSISIPVLVMHGENDALVPVENGYDTHRNIAGSKLFTIPGWGHDLPKELVPTLVDVLLEHFGEATGSPETRTHAPSAA